MYICPTEVILPLKPLGRLRVKEMSSRRKRGLKVKYRKPPVMPRLLWDVPIYLQARCHPELISLEAELRGFVACIGVYLGYIFGWWDDTAARLCLSALAFDAATCLLIFRTVLQGRVLAR